MAKNRAPSKHSRAARRATDIDIDTDKSLKDIKLPKRNPVNARPSVLAVHQSAGVSKKAKSGRKSNLSAKAKRRQERGLEMAEAVVGRTERKVEKSVGRAGMVKSRSKDWESINRLAGLEVEGAGDSSEDDEDAEMGQDATAQKKKKAKKQAAKFGDDGDRDMDAGEAPQQDAAASVPLPDIDGDDEIL